ncbi:MAG: thiamine pyrophosphate-dependent dehydrogenase E1 component subunit alpha [Trueperaceae bacterium]|nr:thiamine pyrophosphate-dependent dehydrogenase E1 component subunit alpha [Trueperaceae bacterium]
MIADKQNFSPFNEEPISLISQAGEWTAPFACDLKDEQLKTMYQQMLAARLMDERFIKLQRSGKMSFVAPHSGHEAAQIAAAHAVRVGTDWLFPYYRDYGMTYALGEPLIEIFAQVTGSRLDTAKARQMPMHPSSKELNIFTGASAIASHIPPAVGAAISMKIRETGQVVLTSFGDGATSEGDFHAAINYAGAQGAPVVFLCENNRLAISVDFNKQTGAENIAIKAKAYGMPGYLVDGMDVLACYYVLQECVENARAGLGPSLVEAQVQRFGAHSSADDDSIYRSKEELEQMRQRDPLLRMRRFLENQGLWSERDENLFKKEILGEFQAIIDTLAEAEKVPLEWMFDDVYAEMLPHIAEQKKDFLG